MLRGTLTVAQALSEVNSSSERITDKGLIFKEPKSEASKRQVSLPAFLREMLNEHLASPTLPGGTGPDSLAFTTTTGLPIRHNLFYKRVFKPAVKARAPLPATRTPSTTSGTRAPR